MKAAGALLILLALQALPGIAWGEIEDSKPFVKIVRLAGEVRIERGGAEPVTAKEGDKLYQGDVLSVDEDAKVQLAFPGNTLVLLKEGSVLSLGELAPAARTRSSLTAGHLIANLKDALSPGSTFEVETPSALAVVRGTVFEIEIDELEEEDEKPTVHFYGHQGEVEVVFAEEVLRLGPCVHILLEAGKLPQILEHSRKLNEILQMFDPEYWEEKAKEEVEQEIRKRLPDLF